MCNNRQVQFGLSSDAMFKLVLGNENNKELTAWVFNHIQSKVQIKAEDIEFMNKEEMIGASFQKGEMDVRFKVKDEVYVDMEVQMYISSKYETLERLDTYHSMLKLASLSKGDNYRKRYTFVIAFCNEIVVKNNEECILVEKNLLGEEEILYEHNKIIIQLPNYKKCDNIIVKELLELMLTNTPNLYRGRNVVMDKIIDEIEKYNSNDALMLAIMRHNDALKRPQFELEMAKERARDEGLKEGRAEGHAEGHAKGICEATLKIAKNLKDNGCSNEFIMYTTGLSKEEVEKL